MDTNSEANTKFLNLLHDAILVTNDEAVVTFANHEALHLLGVGREKLLGQQLRDKLILQTELGQSANVDALLVVPTLIEKKTIIIDRKSDGQLALVRGDRSQFPVSLQSLPYSVVDGGSGMTLIFSDTSSEQKIEQSKSEFVSLVSHQLRTPVNITSWYTEKLLSQKRGNLNEKQYEYLEEIKISNKRIIDLVSSIVNVSRTDLDRLKSKHEEVELISIIHEQVRFFNELAGHKNIHISTVFDVQEYILAESDKEYIMVALHSVINNAIKYTKAGGSVVIGVKTVEVNEEIDSKANYITKRPGAIIEVTDTGLGIPDEQQKQVFEKLFRADNVKALDVTGLGLALYIARSFIQSLDGHIWFESKIREGSVFRIYLPSDT